MHRHFVLSMFVLVALLPGRARAGSFVPDHMELLEPDASIAVWVFLRDKGAREKAAPPPNAVTERARRRRQAAGIAAVDRHDLPLDETYVAAVAERVQRLRQRSRWLNAVSVEVTREQITALRALPFVREIDLVARFRRNPAPEQVAAISPDPSGSPTPAAALLDYGSSLNQLQMLHIVDLHNMGLDGGGVLVAHFDNGYRLLTHEAFAQLRVHAAWDFVANDDDPTEPCPPASECTSHGVETLSILAGFKEGRLIGPAFGATYLLARTESDAVESPAEEDLWVAAVEWADSIGVDVVSSSIGYREFDAPHPSYRPEDMDGDTAVITRAADMAAARGIVVVNGIGNDGLMSAANTIYAPADGDSVLAVGAVDRNGVRTLISSYGPTADGRTKPDVLAQGIGTTMAQASNPMAYGGGFGTSAATPLVAGAAALLRQAFPGATATQIVDALRFTASRAADPDRYEGFGIVDALAAYRYLRVGDDLAERDLQPPLGGRMARIVPNPQPSAPPLAIRIDVSSPARITLRLFDVRGRLVRRLLAATLPAAQHTIAWNGLDDQGSRLAAGAYFVRLRAEASSEPGRVHTETYKLTLLR